jgi:hypothetical protein
MEKQHGNGIKNNDYLGKFGKMLYKLFKYPLKLLQFTCLKYIEIFSGTLYNTL